MTQFFVRHLHCIAGLKACHQGYFESESFGFTTTKQPQGYIFWPFPQLKNREEFERGLEKGRGREKGGKEEKKEKRDKTLVKVPL